MLSKRIVGTCLLLGALTVTSVTLAKAVKVNLVPYNNPVIGLAEPDASGHAILNYDAEEDMTEVQVNAWGLSEPGEYTVYLKAAGWHSIGTFALRKNGSGNLHVRLPGNHSGHLPVAINNPDGYTVLIGG